MQEGGEPAPETLWQPRKLKKRSNKNSDGQKPA